MSQTSQSHQTKSEMMAELMADLSEIKKLRRAMPLFLHLVYVADGTLNATQDQIGKTLGVSGKTIAQWIAELQRSGVVVSERHGQNGGKLQLTPRYLTIAHAPDRIVEEVRVGEAIDDPELKMVIDLYRHNKSKGLKPELDWGVKWSR